MKNTHRSERYRSDRCVFDNSLQTLYNAHNDLKSLLRKFAQRRTFFRSNYLIVITSKNMFDLKVIQAVLLQLEEERGIPQAKVIEAIEFALASAYKKEYGKRGQVIKAEFDMNTGNVEFKQVKTVISKDQIVEDFDEMPEEMDAENEKVFFNDEQHILIEDAKLFKGNTQIGDELVFPLETKGDFGRIASQTAKQVIMQKIREAEKISVVSEYGQHEGKIVNGTVQRMERGSIFVDMGRAVGFLSYDEQIPGERFKQGERIRAYLYKVEESPRGVFLKLSRSHPKFLEQIFFAEVPELAQGVVEIKAIAREAGARSKVAVYSVDEHIDPVGAMVGQQGVRVRTIMSELHGEKIDVIEWSNDPIEFIEEALSPASVLDVQLDEENKIAKVSVSEDQQSLAIGKGGQNARLAAKLTGWKIDVQAVQSTEYAEETEN